MTEQKHDILKEHLNRWMIANTDAYDAFEKMMNEQSNKGYGNYFDFVYLDLFAEKRKHNTV